MSPGTVDSSRALLLERRGPAVLEPVADGWWQVGFRALGSACELFVHASTAASAKTFRDRALAWLLGFELKFSRYLPDSLLSRINANAGSLWTEIDEETEVLLSLCDRIHFTTGGAFDATSLPLSRLWDWQIRHDRLPSDGEIAAARRLVNWTAVLREKGRVFLPTAGMQLDFGGIGKEFAVDVLVRLGKAAGLRAGMIDLGGDIAVWGESPEGGGWTVGLEHPTEPGRCHCGIRLRDGSAVATSGNGVRRFTHDGRSYGHIIDCRTGRPVDNGTESVSVVARSCVAAGILSTSAMVLGGQEALRLLSRQHQVEGCLWHGRTLLQTARFRSFPLPDDWS